MVIACVQTSPLATKEIGDVSTLGSGGEGGELPYKSDRDALQKIKIKPLRDNKVGVAQA